MYSIKASVQGHYESLDEITFYTLRITHSPSGLSWITNRKLEEFHSLYTCLCDKFKEVPEPPGYRTLSYLSLYFTSVIPSLNSFLASVLEIPSIFTSEEIFTFFDVNLHLPKHQSLKVLQSKQYDTSYIVSMVHKCEEFFITAEVDYATLHRFEKYLQIIGYSGSIMTRIKIFSGSCVSQYFTVQVVTALAYCFKNQILVLGCENGNLELVRTSSRMGSFTFESIRKVTVHATLVNAILCEEERIFSCDQEGRLIVISTESENELIDITLSFLPKKMALSEDITFLYFCSEKQIHILDVSTFQYAKSFSVEFQTVISAFTVSQKGFILVGGCDGQIIVYSNAFEVIQKFTVAATVTCIDYNEKLKIIAISDLNGVVTIWNSSGNAIFRWKTHDSTTCVLFHQSQYITTGKDLTIRYWKLTGLFEEHEQQSAKSLSS